MAYPAGSTVAPDHWKSTRAQTALVTQIASDESEYLGAAQRDIGRLVGQVDRELFVSCAAGDALRQQFETLQPEFVAVHDVGTRLSRQLLDGIAKAGQRPVQTLAIRRQGFGTALASLQFVELSTPDGSQMRLYSTEADADTATRHAVARTLLAFSRLGVMMVGELPAHALATQFNPWRDELLRGPWPNRHLLLLPMSAGTTVAAQGEQLGLGSAVTVRTTPRVTKPAEAWNFISGTWSRLREQMQPAGPSSRFAEPVAAIRRMAMPTGTPASPPSATMPAPALPVRAAHAAPHTPLPHHTSHAPLVDSPALALRGVPFEPVAPARLMPTAHATAASPAVPSALLQHYTKQVSELGGVTSCCVFDLASGQTRAQAGGWPEAADLALHGKALVAAMIDNGRSLGLGSTPPEAAISFGDHHLLLRALPPQHPGLVLHAVLDKSRANLMLVRAQLQRLDTTLSD